MARRPTQGKDDIQLEPPQVKSAETVPAVEDRTYLAFMVAALAIAVGIGFAFAVVIPLASSGVLGGADRVPWLIQAHGWAQLQGWAGLFVAGMAVRIIPRFAGRKPIPRNVTLPVVVLLVVSVVVRSVVQPWSRGEWGDAVLIGAAAAGALGMVGVVAVLATTLWRTRRHGNPWEWFAWAGTGWWGAWAALTVVAAVRSADNFGLAPYALNSAMTWIVILGAIGNFVWGVQSRSVPIFFGRKPPRLRTVIVPMAVLNAGIALLVVSLADWSVATSARFEGTGLALAGVAVVVLAPVCGAVWGRAHRLRPRARNASRFVIAANIAAAVGGALLVVAGARMLFEGEVVALELRDAARHAFGIGMITMLILGMAQLIAPVFAMSRAEPRRPSLVEWLPFPLLAGALVIRVGSALLRPDISSDAFHHSTALAGTMAWSALVFFAVSVVLAIQREPRMKELLAGRLP